MATVGVKGLTIDTSMICAACVRVTVNRIHVTFNWLVLSLPGFLIFESDVLAQKAVRFDRGPQSTLVHMQPYRETDTTYSI